MCVCVFFFVLLFYDDHFMAKYKYIPLLFYVDMDSVCVCWILVLIFSSFLSAIFRLSACFEQISNGNYIPMNGNVQWLVMNSMDKIFCAYEKFKSEKFNCNIWLHECDGFTYILVCIDVYYTLDSGWEYILVVNNI